LVEILQAVLLLLELLSFSKTSRVIAHMSLRSFPLTLWSFVGQILSHLWLGALKTLSSLQSSTEISFTLPKFCITCPIRTKTWHPTILLEALGVLCSDIIPGVNGKHSLSLTLPTSGTPQRILRCFNKFGAFRWETRQWWSLKNKKKSWMMTKCFTIRNSKRHSTLFVDIHPFQRFFHGKVRTVGGFTPKLVGDDNSITW
jgi:hypothetical protein